MGCGCQKKPRLIKQPGAYGIPLPVALPRGKLVTKQIPLIRIPPPPVSFVIASARTRRRTRRTVF